MQENWDRVYSKRFGGTWYPDEGIVRFTARYLQRRVGIDIWDRKRKAGRVLDAGCGNGRHVAFFAEQGFDVYGIDISSEAVEIARAWLGKKGLKAKLHVGDLEKLPFETGFFDTVICHEVLDHLKFSRAKESLEEINRVSSKGAYIYLSLRSTEDSECGRGQEVEKNTFILREGYEKGIIQHFFDLDEVRELLREFKVFDIECYEQKFPEAFTVDKAFLQSSRGEKKFIDLSKHVNLGLKYSRWYVAAEKG